MCDTQNEHRLLGGRRDTRARKKEKIEKKKERKRERREKVFKGRNLSVS
jgi:hypothetical protein